MARSPWQPHKGQAFPCQSTESDRPIRRERHRMQSAMITALRRQEPGGGQNTPTRPQQDPSSENMTSLRPAGQICSEDATFSYRHYMWHLPWRAVGCNGTYTTHSALGMPETSAWRVFMVCAEDLHHLSDSIQAALPSSLHALRRCSWIERRLFQSKKAWLKVLDPTSLTLNTFKIEDILGFIGLSCFYHEKIIDKLFKHLSTKRNFEKKIWNTLKSVVGNYFFGLLQWGVLYVHSSVRPFVHQSTWPSVSMSVYSHKQKNSSVAV